MEISIYTIDKRGRPNKKAPIVEAYFLSHTDFTKLPTATQVSLCTIYSAWTWQCFALAIDNLEKSNHCIDAQSFAPVFLGRKLAYFLSVSSSM